RRLGRAHHHGRGYHASQLEAAAESRRRQPPLEAHHVNLLGLLSHAPAARSIATRWRRGDWARRGARSPRTERVAAIFLFTMSNSAVFFVPAARCCARVLLLSVPSTPRGASGAPKGAGFLLSRS